MISSSGSASRSTASPGDAIKVMVVDDSAVIRGLLTKALEQDPEIQVVASVSNGQMAVNTVSRQEVDVVVLDIEMPVMDGLTALPLLLKASPRSRIVMASTLTRRGADITIKAMAAGAADYLPKPTATRDIHGADSFRQELIQKVKALGRSVRPASSSARRAPFSGTPGIGSAGSGSEPPGKTMTAGRNSGSDEKPVGNKAPSAPAIRPIPRNFRPAIVAIGSSTGGPQALFEVIGALSPKKGGALSVPIIVTQHMPATFTTILAEHIARQCQIEAIEVRDGDPLLPGRVHIAPGQFHMVVGGSAGAPVLRTNQDPQENFCRPSVDPMMRSVVKIFGGRGLAVILTGMGHDGLNGCRQLVDAGGVVIAQDEASSVVWGMPGAVANGGLCSEILPLARIGPSVRKLVAH